MLLTLKCNYDLLVLVHQHNLVCLGACLDYFLLWITNEICKKDVSYLFILHKTKIKKCISLIVSMKVTLVGVL